MDKPEIRIVDNFVSLDIKMKIPYDNKEQMIAAVTELHDLMDMVADMSKKNDTEVSGHI